ncbi:hypothetical protein [Xylanimonas allomyrinae]|uniref:hypothetical protein n=1 Tax=Xylanimonas allomyrinae TaxID=2509459 RepID=UPI0013A6241D|nr:hypothetical protein [Xylanimonas allomyrinae]
MRRFARADGRCDPERVLRLTDADGVTLAEALGRAGRAAGLPGGDPRDWYGADPEALARVGAFVELHTEEGAVHGLSGHGDPPVAVGEGVWPHGRWRADLRGGEDGAGPAGRARRDDPMRALAGLVRKMRAAAERHSVVASVGKVRVDPGHADVHHPRVSAWIDVRGPREADVRAAADALGMLTLESWSPAVHFDDALAARVSAVVGRSAYGTGAAPRVPTGAGHDAGVLASAWVPTAMIFVRDPDRAAARDDDATPAARAGAALTHVLADLAGTVKG